MGSDIKRLVSEFRKGLEAIYGDRLRGMLLYGSYARGEEEDGSDVDVLVVLDDIGYYTDEIKRTGGLVSSLSLEYGKTLSPVFARERSWKGDDTPFFANVREESLAV
jgi:predicted nucleotidyltransferase